MEKEKKLESNGRMYTLEDLTKGFIKELETEITVPLSMRYDKEHDIIISMDNHYNYLSLEEIKFVIQKLQNTLDKVSQEEIDEANEKVMNDLNKEYDNLVKEKPNAREKKKGYIYFISNGLGHYKIGYSKNVKSRFTSIQTSTSLKLTLNCSIKTNDMVKVEEFFHDKFKKRKIQGEWFELTDKDILYIRKCDYPKEIMQEIIFDEVIANE